MSKGKKDSLQFDLRSSKIPFFNLPTLSQVTLSIWNEDDRPLQSLDFDDLTDNNGL